MVSTYYFCHSRASSHPSLSATALQSLEIACDTILSGKAKVMIAGGFDDISEEGSYEFANIKQQAMPRLSLPWVVSLQKCPVPLPPPEQE